MVTPTKVAIAVDSPDTLLAGSIATPDILSALETTSWH
jgi:hypothetical protein